MMLQVPSLVDKYMSGKTRLDDYITHRMPFDKVWLASVSFCEGPCNPACPSKAAPPP